MAERVEALVTEGERCERPAEGEPGAGLDQGRRARQEGEGGRRVTRHCLNASPNSFH